MSDINKELRNIEEKIGYEIGNTKENIVSPEMTLFKCNNIYYETMKDTYEYFGKNILSLSKNSEKLEYYRTFAGKDDVIRISSSYKKKDKIYCAVNNEMFVVYNHEKSINADNPIWEIEYGDFLKDIYIIFKEKGIMFTNDIYKNNYNKLGEGFLCKNCNKEEPKQFVKKKNN